MYTIILMIFFAGFFMFYNTSRRAVFSRPYPWQHFLATHTVLSRGIGTGLLLLGWFLLILQESGASGSFAVLAYLMCAGSVLVILVPLRLWTMPGIAVLLLMSFTLEMLIR